MSMFLGPIHFWLYKKIGNQENLTAFIATQAEKHGWIGDSSVYIKDLPTLESVIDENNIHGWLQSRIADAEVRYSSLITTVASELDTVKQWAFEFGKQYAIDSNAAVIEVYKYFEDFFVNGMPCDRVNAITEQSETALSWEMSQDIHAQYWNDGDTVNYYNLRKIVMDGMLDGMDYTVTMSDPYHYTIQKE